MDLVLLLLKSLKGDLISSLNQTVLLSSLAEKTTLLKHELLKRIKKGLKMNFQGFYIFWQTTEYSKGEEKLTIKKTLPLFVIYSDNRNQ